MLGDVFVDTAHAFVNGFLKELMKDGQVDRAMTEARNRVADRPDHWAPVLFTRLVDGRLWYTRGGRRAGRYALPGLAGGDQPDRGGLLRARPGLGAARALRRIAGATWRDGSPT